MHEKKACEGSGDVRDPVRKQDKASQREEVHMELDLEAPSKEAIYYSFLLFRKEQEYLFSKSFFGRQQDW